MPSPSSKLTENNHTNIKFCHASISCISLHFNSFARNIAFNAINTKGTKWNKLHDSKNHLA
ncbi:uncharacterized protein PHALS_15367 [Plasmopara halstedii]|uniref:Uncharacterized protein n=1 Tax=Plasmopara halstedii TaxID=4781 RepID=A0A0P1AEL1_PLAHL|nr:uncharacterized protein PHALS_15367 [Plasmopara halstedii]CEG39278.1 hypothetical protein PHALS_15367 [Plasmopara halstedii]|eukprot:XP_024575647.1 hypothetical protein PHALS_15367 [Plasmopara halstedii]